MGLYLLLGIGAIGLLGLAFDWFDTDDDDDDDSTETVTAETPGTTPPVTEPPTSQPPVITPPPPLVGGETETGGDPITVESGETVVGTDGNDLITYVPPSDGGAPNPLSVDGAAGNDTLDMTPTAFDPDGPALPDLLLDSTISGGFGNDLIDAQAADSEIFGNNGNDTITGAYLGSIIDAGVGNDVVDVTAPGDTVTVEGGEGRDVLTAAADNGAVVNGGTGNDSITGFSGVANTGPNAIDGQDGNDFLTLDATATPTFFDSQGLTATGGTGADTFALLVGEGVADTGLWEGGSVVTSDFGAARVDAGTITDFTLGEDLLRIDATPVSEGFELTEIALTEVNEFVDDRINSFTELSLTFDGEGQTPRVLVFTLEGVTGLDAEDFELIGAPQTLLEMVPVLIVDPAIPEPPVTVGEPVMAPA